MKKALVIIPTYNERETLPKIIGSVLKHPSFDILVIDDSSPDGTAGLVRDMPESGKRIKLIERAEKLGLGTAYVEGFKWGLDKGYDYFIEMDADGSHDPDVLPLFIEEIEKGYGLVIGSRYTGGSISVVGWDFRRLMLSKSGNYYVSWMLGLKLSDLTSGFRCYARNAMESIDLGRIHSNGYAFQVEMAFRISTAGYSVGEVPIIFYERESGSSKMSRKIIREAFILPWRLRLERLVEAAIKDVGYNAGTIAGFCLIVAGVTSGLWLGWWLGTEGDIIELIHVFKLGLPAWAWMAMKIGLAAGFSMLFFALLVAAAIAVFAGAGRK